METIYSLFQNIVSAYPDKPAVIDNSRLLTFRELSGMVDRISETFPENIHSVGIVMHHCPEMIASILAVLRCGARYIPAEPDFPIGRIREMMAESGVDFILTEESLMDELDEFPLRRADAWQAASGSSLPGKPDASDPQSPAYVLYTSGTTGHPKGVCVLNRNVCNYVRAFDNEFHPRPGDIMLQYSPCSFDIFVEEVFTSLLNGAAIAIPSGEERGDLHALMDFVARHHVTIISCFPYLLAEMNSLPSIPSSLRLLISGGDVLRKIYVDRLLDQAVVYNTYGPSETTVCASYFRCTTESVLEDGTFPIGRPVKGVNIRILDQDGAEVPDGETGEICITGAGVSSGYIGDHAEENKAFVKIPGGGVMYMSGDLGYMLPDGNLAFLYRKDNQIMIYGKRVEVAEVESRLNQCRNVHQGVVRALTDEDGLSYMVAYVVPSEGNIDIQNIKRELSEYLASFMIPEFFVEMSSLPLNVNGKIDSARLPVVEKKGIYTVSH